MLRRMTVAVPAEEVPAMRELLQTLCAVKAEPSASRAGAEPDDGEASALQDLLTQADAPTAPGSVLKLTGPAGLIREAAYGLLLDGVDGLAETCRAYESGDASLTDLIGAGRSAGRRLALLREIEDRDGWSGG